MENIVNYFGDTKKYPIKFAVTGGTHIERLFIKSCRKIMERPVQYRDKPYVQEGVSFTYHPAAPMQGAPSYLEGADFIEVASVRDSAVVARLKVTGGSGCYYVAAMNEPFLTFMQMQFT